MQTSVEEIAAPGQALAARPRERALRRGFVRFTLRTVGAPERLCIAPAVEGVALTAIARGAEVRFDPEEVSVETAGPLAQLKALMPSKAALRFGPLSVRPDGAADRVKIYRKLVKFARTSGFAFDGETMRRLPELALGWANEAEAAPIAPDSPAIAVALHLHYVELWPEIRTLLKRWRRPLSLLVSLTSPDDAARGAILDAFPDAQIENVENSGRDVRPFLVWLESGRLDRFDLVCKIHGKRSLRDGASPLFGELFRRASFLDLVGDSARVQDICNQFADQPNLGLVGSERFRAYSRHGDPREVMGASRERIEALAARMGAPHFDEGYDVFHGTMFWVRPAALQKLRDLRLAGAFAPETGLSDGALEHAVEGLINHAVRAAGYRIEGTTAP